MRGLGGRRSTACTITIHACVSFLSPLLPAARIMVCITICTRAPHLWIGPLEGQPPFPQPVLASLRVVFLSVFSPAAAMASATAIPPRRSGEEVGVDAVPHRLPLLVDGFRGHVPGMAIKKTGPGTQHTARRRQERVKGLVHLPTRSSQPMQRFHLIVHGSQSQTVFTPPCHTVEHMYACTHSRAENTRKARIS